MDLTDEQKNIIDAFYHQKFLLVNALAGTGKTSTALECVKKNNHLNGAYLCFNNSISGEMNGKLRNIQAENTFASTIHSLALNIVKNYLGNRSIDDKAIYQYVDVICSFKRNGGGSYTDKHDLLRLRAIARNFISAWCHSAYLDFDKFLLEYNPKTVYGQLKNLNTDIDHFHSQMKNFWNKILADDNLPISHDIYLKIFHLNFREIVKQLNFDFIIADEAQDLFPLAEDIIKVFYENGSSILCLGDRYQQIYAWNKSINTMERLEKDALALNLTQSFRCGPEIIEKALPWLRLLGYNGRFLARNCEANPKYPFAVLSRTVCGVFDILRQCTESGLQNNEIYLINGNTGQGYDFSIIQDRLHFMAGRRNKISNTNMRQCVDENAYDKLALAFMDREMIKAKNICDKLGFEKTQKLLNAINRGDFANAESDSQVAVGTGHKAKGMEFGHTILENFSNFMQDYKKWKTISPQYGKPRFSSRIPSGNEIRRYEICDFIANNNVTGDIPLYIDAEELRINYVAITRAIDTLNPCGLDLCENGYYKEASQLINDKKVVLIDRDMNGNIVEYKRQL